MSFLRQKSTAVAPAYTGMQIQTSSGALPIPILWGANQLAPNAIWSGNFRAIPQYAQSSGKGGGGKTATGYDYQTAVVMGLCEGPIAGIGSIWNSQTVSTLASLGLTLFSGETPQSAWPYLTTAFPSQALGYNGTAYVCSSDYDMGSSAGLSALTFEILGLLTASAVVNTSDADPALVIQDFLVNPQYGVGFPAASLDAASLLGPSGGASYQAYCQAAGLALSPALINQEPANSILTRWLQLTNTAAVWSDGLLKFIPYGDASLTGALASGASAVFIPNLTSIYDLDDDDFVSDPGEDPVEVARTDPYAASNMQRLEISQRSNYYDATPIVAFDQNAIDEFGLRIAATITAHEICDPSVAQVSAQLILQRGLYIRNTYTFSLSWEYCLLEPMDLVTLTDVGLGLSKAVVRIVGIEEDGSGLLTMTAEEFPGGIASAAAYPVQSGSSSPINRGVTPAPVNRPIIFEPPAALTGGAGQIWIAASGGQSLIADPNWGGANVWLSTDATTFSQIGQIAAPCRQGALTAPLATFSTSNPDTVDALAVNMAQSNGQLTSATIADANNALTLSIVDQELLAYANATLTGPNAYSLTYLQRGLYGTPPQAHAAGAPFARLDQAIFKYPLPDALIGQTLYLKLQSFNIFGAGVQDLSTCAVYSYTPRGSGVVGPVTQALMVGTNLDYGLASGAPAAADDFGLASDPFVTLVDLGPASS